MRIDIDLGDDHLLRFYPWAPDRELNPDCAGIPDVEKFAATIAHKKADGSDCLSAVTFEGEVQCQVAPHQNAWTVESWEPLTLSPSVLCRTCGDHGFIRGGKWVRA